MQNRHAISVVSRITPKRVIIGRPNALPGMSISTSISPGPATAAVASWRLKDLGGAVHVGVEGVKLSPARNSALSDRLDVARVQGVALFAVRQHGAWVLAASLTDDVYKVLVMGDSKGPRLHNGELVHSGDLVVLPPASRHVLVGTGGDFVCVEIPTPMFEAAVGSDRWSREKLGWHLPGADVDGRMHRQVQEMTLGLCTGKPPTSGALLKLQEQLFATLAVEAPHAVALPPSKQGHHKVFLRAFDHMNDHLREDVYMAELSRVSGLSERSLRQVFRDYTTVPPMVFLNRLRYQRAQRNLLWGDCDSTSVKFAALDSGFTDLGRFSVNYRKLFGEKPSETLGRAVERTR